MNCVFLKWGVKWLKRNQVFSVTGHVRSCSQQFLTSAAETLARPELWALSWAFFYGFEMRGNHRPEWAPIALLSQRVCVCLCGGERGYSRLCALSFFMLPCFDVPSHPFIPHAPCASGFWFAAHQRWGLRKAGRELGVCRCFSQRHCLFCQSRKRWKCCPWGHSHRAQSAVGGWGGVTRG